MYNFTNLIPRIIFVCEFKNFISTFFKFLNGEIPLISNPSLWWQGHIQELSTKELTSLVNESGFYKENFITSKQCSREYRINITFKKKIKRMEEILGRKLEETELYDTLFFCGTKSSEK